MPRTKLILPPLHGAGHAGNGGAGEKPGREKNGCSTAAPVPAPDTDLSVILPLLLLLLSDGADPGLILALIYIMM